MLTNILFAQNENKKSHRTFILGESYQCSNRESNMDSVRISYFAVFHINTWWNDVFRFEWFHQVKTVRILQFFSIYRFRMNSHWFNWALLCWSIGIDIPKSLKMIQQNIVSKFLLFLLWQQNISKKKFIFISTTCSYLIICCFRFWFFTVKSTLLRYCNIDVNHSRIRSVSNSDGIFAQSSFNINTTNRTVFVRYEPLVHAVHVK